MSPSVDQAKALYELQQLEKAITTALDLTCEILPRSAAVPIDTLTVALELDRHERTRIASLMFIPLEDSDVEHIKLLQFYCETPIHVEAHNLNTVLQLLGAITLKIPLGAFSVNEEGIVVFKYVYALGKFKATDPEEFLETYLMWMFALDSLSGLIEDVATGEQNLAAALQNLDE